MFPLEKPYYAQAHDFWPSVFNGLRSSTCDLRSSTRLLRDHIFRKPLTNNHLPHCHTWRTTPFGMVMVFMVLEYGYKNTRHVAWYVLDRKVLGDLKGNSVKTIKAHYVLRVCPNLFRSLLFFTCQSRKKIWRPFRLPCSSDGSVSG
jgi:hypothetical protein